VGPGDLSAVLSQLPRVHHPGVMLGLSSLDDAGAYRLGDGRVLVQTVDFFTPIVDDPYSFGAIAAANAFSDIYAMGIEPMVALNIVAFPIQKLPKSILVEMLKGAMEKAEEAGVAVIGGHSIDDPEPKMGMAVSSIAEAERLVRADTTRPGDVIYLTKPLGMGIIATAIKKGQAPEPLVERAVQIMSELNRPAMLAMREAGASACTDVTGFGLLGHLREVMEASGTSAEINLAAVPVLGEAFDLAVENSVPGGTLRNLSWIDPVVDWDGTVQRTDKIILADAQTSGGLLIFVPEKNRAAFEASLKKYSPSAEAAIGRVVSREKWTIRVRAPE